MMRPRLRGRRNPSRELDLHLPELIFLVGRVPIVPYGTSGTPDLGDRVVPYLEGREKDA
jgi:hypothetical protein